MDGAVPSYVLYSPQGSKPLAGLHVEAGHASRCYDKSTKSQLLQMSAGARVSFLRAPASSLRPGRGVSAASQRLIALQLCCEIPARGAFALAVEFTLQDRGGRRRLLFSTNCAASKVCAQHVKLPLRCAAPGRWTNFIFDVPRLHAARGGGGAEAARRLTQMTLSCSAVCYVRRVMGLPKVPAAAEEWPLAFVLPESVPVWSWVIRTGDEAFLSQRVEVAAEAANATENAANNAAEYAAGNAAANAMDKAVSQHESSPEVGRPSRVASHIAVSSDEPVERLMEAPASYETQKPLSSHAHAKVPETVLPHVVIPNAVILNAVLPHMRTESTGDYAHALEVMRERMRRIQMVVGDDDKEYGKTGTFGETPQHPSRNKPRTSSVRSNAGGVHLSTVSPASAQKVTDESAGSSVVAGLHDSLGDRTSRSRNGAYFSSPASPDKKTHSGEHSDANEDNDEDEDFTVNVCMSACAPPPPAVVMPPDVTLSKPPVAPPHAVDCLCLDPELLDEPPAPPPKSPRASDFLFPSSSHSHSHSSSAAAAAAVKWPHRRGRLNDAAAPPPPPSETSTVPQTEEAASSVSDYRRPVTHRQRQTEKFIHVQSARGEEEDAQSVLNSGATPEGHSHITEVTGNENKSPFVFDPILQCCLDLRTNTYVMMLHSPEDHERQVANI